MNPKTSLKFVILISFFFNPSAYGQINFEREFGDLFKEVQTQAIFEDSKTFPDCVPLYSSTLILKKYEEAKNSKNFDLKRFVLDHFELPFEPPVLKINTATEIKEHILELWPVLTRNPDTLAGSLIPLPHSYIVPGGRFREVYYWDSYFTMLGLKVSAKTELIEDMIENFSYLINRYGFIPNGNRTYYLSRSQPPFFSLMIKLLSKIKGDSILVKYLPQLEREYGFWMEGQQNLSPTNRAERHVVRLPGGEILNRYWDSEATPRQESYKEDISIASSSSRKDCEVYRNIRAACESGWDFSSRWFDDGKTLSTIHTTDILPVDLNCLLFHLEVMIAKANKLKGNTAKRNTFFEYSERRKKAILKYCWGERTNFFYDYDFIKNKVTQVMSLAGVYPLYFMIASENQALKVAETLERSFVKPGGLITTLVNTGQQWDAPNGWAPLQWLTIRGLENYNFYNLATTIKQRWIENNTRVYKNTGKLMEKYNVENISLEAGGGEYPSQDGFGWTNGVLLDLMNE